MADAESPALPLLQVPPEILDRITWHLQTTELCNFRLTCKSAEQAVHFRFTSEFFTRKQFMVSEFSLRALVDISKSRFASHLRHVHISLDQVDEAASSRVSMSPKTRRLYKKRLAEQSTLWTLGLVPKYLADAFSRLPNLETVALRDFNSTRRSRDGPHAQWRSYGSQTLADETGAQPVTVQLSLGSTAPPDRANVLFKAIIHGLGLADVRLKNLEVMERNGNVLFDAAFLLHPDFEAAYAPVLGNLQKLHLCIDFYRVTSPFDAQPYNQENLIRFLSQCQGLEELRINGKRHGGHSKGGRTNLHLFVSWLAASEAKPLSQLQSADISVDDGQETPPAVEFPHLSNLSLGMMALTVDEVVHLVTKFASSLQYLELWRFQLAGASWGTVVDMEQGKKQNLFISLLKRLLAVPNLNLRHIKLGMLEQMLDDGGRFNKMRTIEFTKDKLVADGEKDVATLVAQQGKPTNNFMEYTGSDWRHFVRHEMIPRLYMVNPNDGDYMVDQHSSDEESEDHSEDDEDEEMDE